MINLENDYVLQLDIKGKRPDVVPRFVQYDYAELNLYVSDAGKAYDLSLFDRVEVYHRLPDGTVVTKDAELVLGATIADSYIRYLYDGTEMHVTGSIATSIAMFATDAIESVSVKDGVSLLDARISIQPFQVRILPQEKREI